MSVAYSVGNNYDSRNDPEEENVKEMIEPMEEQIRLSDLSPENQTLLAGQENGVTNEMRNGKERTKGESDVTIEDRRDKRLLYNVADHPPILLTIISGVQQTLLSLSGVLGVAFLVASVTCAENDEAVKAKLLSSTFFMTGVTTIFMSLIGIRLPLFQGAAGDFLVPLLVMQVLYPDRCSFTDPLKWNQTANASDVFDKGEQSEFILNNIRELQGSLIAAGVFQCLVGATGLVGVLLKFIGPITIVPTILLNIVFIVRATVKFAMVYWGVSLTVAAIALILSLYLSHHDCPLPFWSRKKGFHIVYYPLHQVFSLLISMLIGWLLCGILTAAGVFSDDPEATNYLARTDVKLYIIEQSPWISVPYPGQFGNIRFSVSVFVGFLIGTITSILDSVGDYYACAKMCDAPPPPRHAVNRGIAIEGLMSTVSGLVGCGTATTTYAGNIGAIGVTKVASRDVFIATGVIYVIFGVVGKISSVFLTIPYPVLGGALAIMFGMFFGVVLSNLQVVSLSSTRNLAIIGVAILFGMMMPYYVENYKDQISVGNPMADSVIKMLLANPCFSGGFLACFLDNTVRGTREERGIAAWQNQMEGADDSDDVRYSVGYEIYQPLLYKWISKVPYMTKLPFWPNKEVTF